MPVTVSEGEPQTRPGWRGLGRDTEPSARGRACIPHLTANFVARESESALCGGP